MDATKPCDLSCEKCGHADVHRTFRASGDSWRIEDYGKARNRYASASSHLATAYRDHIAHCCRCCGYTWQTRPLPKPKRVKRTPASQPEGVAE